LAVTEPTMAPPRPAPPIEKLPVKVSAEHALIVRGAGGSDTFLADLGKALEAYRGDDYGTAAQRLGEVAARYPRAVEPPLYQGVSLLMLGRASEAIAPLERALALDPSPEQRRDAEFHLALAQLHSGQDQGRRTLKQLCAADGPYRTQSCHALDAVPSPR